MQKNVVIRVLEYYQEKYNVKQKFIYDGICAASTFSKAKVSDKAHNMIKLVKRNGWDESYLEEVKTTLRQAYFIAAARREEGIAKTIKDYYIKNFEEFAHV